MLELSKNSTACTTNKCLQSKVHKVGALLGAIKAPLVVRESRQGPHLFQRFLLCAGFGAGGRHGEEETAGALGEGLEATIQEGGGGFLCFVWSKCMSQKIKKSKNLSLLPLHRGTLLHCRVAAILL